MQVLFTSDDFCRYVLRDHAVRVDDGQAGLSPGADVLQAYAVQMALRQALQEDRIARDGLGLDVPEDDVPDDRRAFGDRLGGVRIVLLVGVELVNADRSPEPAAVLVLQAVVVVAQTLVGDILDGAASSPDSRHAVQECCALGDVQYHVAVEEQRPTDIHSCRMSTVSLG